MDYASILSREVHLLTGTKGDSSSRCKICLVPIFILNNMLNALVRFRQIMHSLYKYGQCFLLKLKLKFVHIVHSVCAFTDYSNSFSKPFLLLIPAREKGIPCKLIL